MENKTCLKCGRNLPATAEYFHRHKRYKDGLRSTCKECRKRIRAEQYQENPDKFKERSRRYFIENREANSIKCKKWYRDNKKANTKRCNQYYKENKDKLREYIKNFNQKRRALIKETHADLTPEEWIDIKEFFNNSCAYCGMTEEEHLSKFGEQIHQDHFIPLSKGGEYSKDNIIPSCRSCNSSKNDKEFWEWYPQHESYDPKREQFILNYFKLKKSTYQVAKLD